VAQLSKRTTVRKRVVMKPPDLKLCNDCEAVSVKSQTEVGRALSGESRSDLRKRRSAKNQISELRLRR
jgi:hypothetical protein